MQTHIVLLVRLDRGVKFGDFTGPAGRIKLSFGHNRQRSTTGPEVCATPRFDLG